MFTLFMYGVCLSFAWAVHKKSPNDFNLKKLNCIEHECYEYEDNFEYSAHDEIVFG